MTEAPSPLRAMLDTMVYDKIVASLELRQLIESAVAIGRLSIFSTHVQRDQISNIPDPHKREAALRISTLKVSTSGAAWNVSRWGDAEWGDESTSAFMREIDKGIPKHVKDALIAVTASRKCDVLVTDDRRLVNRVQRAGSGIRILTTEDFQKLLSSMPRDRGVRLRKVK
jgi:hypothetical protein